MPLDVHALERAYASLPDAAIPGLDAKWLGPQAHGELAPWVRSLSLTAYGHIAYSRWMDPITAVPSMHRDDGSIDPDWVLAVQAAATRLVAAESLAGTPAGRRWWVSWLLYELAAPHRMLSARFSSGPTL